MPNIEAHAKINLSLEVLGRRDDGFHDLVSVMQTVSLADTLSIKPAEGLVFSCTGRPIGPGANLVMRAAELLRERFDVAAGCAISLDKQIPVAAGLGGGSADAAATLVGLRRLWRLPVDCEQLVGLAAELGSDVPFFLWGGTAFVSGRGERVQPLPSVVTRWYLLVNPRCEVSTTAVFAELSRSEWSDGELTRRLARSIDIAPCPGVNSLAPALFRLSPAARDCFAALKAAAPNGARISGSGPTMFAAFPTRVQAEEASAALSQFETVVVRSHFSRPQGSPCAA